MRLAILPELSPAVAFPDKTTGLPACLGNVLWGQVIVATAMAPRTAAAVARQLAQFIKSVGSCRMMQSRHCHG